MKIPSIAAQFLTKGYNILPYAMTRKACDLGKKILFREKYNEMVDFLEKQEDPEIKDLLPSIRECGMLSTLYGDWTKKYAHLPDMLNRDHDKEFYYVNHQCQDGSIKKIFLQDVLGHSQCRTYYETLLMEQDEQSPHCYLTGRIKEDLIGDKGGTILDLGGAEGIFTLECVDHVDRLYCFDADEKWLKPLRETLKPYADKAEVVSKYISDISEGPYTTIDDFFGDKIPKDIRMIKMDIEGYELNALRGMKHTLEENPNAVLLICTYHKPDAEKEITGFMSEMGYKGLPRSGFVFFWAGDDFVEPYVRHGVVEFRK